jgi:hypothetical protein
MAARGMLLQRWGLSMAFTARIKGTDDLFNAVSEWDPLDDQRHDAHEIRDGASYSGHRFMGVQRVEGLKFTYTGRIDATLSSEDLEPYEENGDSISLIGIPHKETRSTRI